MRKPVILIVALIAALLIGCKEDTAGPLRMGRRQFHLNDSTEYLAIIGDIQSMVHYPANRDYLKATAHWLIWQYALHPESLRAVILTGDITEDNSPEEWRIAGELLSDLAATVPVILTTGNHDYNTDEGRASTGINNIAPAGAARRAIVASFEEGRVFCAHHFDLNASGRPVCSVLFNLQSQAYGGDGWLMLWQTSDGTTVESVLFNAVSDNFCSDSFANFAFRL